MVFSLNSYANNAEIEHLIGFVASTTCTYERNGEPHTGKEAAQHIQKKYDYYVDEIKTTEDFIKLAATKSKMSGKAYLVKCLDQQPIESAKWLMNELADFRRQQPSNFN
jgi:hypothetical protein